MRDRCQGVLVLAIARARSREVLMEKLVEAIVLRPIEYPLQKRKPEQPSSDQLDREHHEKYDHDVR